jgi:hypothetical protein
MEYVPMTEFTFWLMVIVSNPNGMSVADPVGPLFSQEACDAAGQRALHGSKKTTFLNTKVEYICVSQPVEGD